jgi:glucose/arabinose dehydrogenase
MWASEFGEDATDELNLIQPGRNYGWPLREGTTGVSDPGLTDPVATWTVAEASPAGITVVGDTVFVAALRGRRLLAVDVSASPATTTSHFVNTVGRIRDVTPGPGSTIWVLTSNSDGFGTPQAGDERLLSVPVG